MTTKICLKCKIEKNIDNFCRDKNKKDGYNIYCKSCVVEYGKIYRRKNKKRLSKQAGEYYQNNKIEILNCNRLYRHKHPTYMKEYYKRNIMKRKKQDQEYYKNNIARQMFNSSRRRARIKDIPHNITIEDIQKEIDNIKNEKDEYICPVLNIEICINTGTKRKYNDSMSLDRINNSKGYIKGNICVISWRANKLKCDASIEEIKNMYNYIQSYYRDL